MIEDFTNLIEDKLVTAESIESRNFESNKQTFASQENCFLNQTPSSGRRKRFFEGKVE